MELEARGSQSLGADVDGMHFSSELCFVFLTNGTRCVLDDVPGVDIVWRISPFDPAYALGKQLYLAALWSGHRAAFG